MIAVILYMDGTINENYILMISDELEAQNLVQYCSCEDDFP